MWSIPSKEQLARLPGLGKTDGIPFMNKLIYLHLFLGGCDWYIAEFDGDDTFFGYAIINNDLENAEWGYISFAELKEIRVPPGFEIDCEV